MTLQDYQTRVDLITSILDDLHIILSNLVYLSAPWIITNGRIIKYELELEKTIAEWGRGHGMAS